MATATELTTLKVTALWDEFFFQCLNKRGSFTFFPLPHPLTIRTYLKSHEYVNAILNMEMQNMQSNSLSVKY